MDELAAVANVEPLSFRMQMLGGHPRLAHCLTSVATMGGWQGGIHGSGQGLACAMMGGGHIAAMVEAGLDGGRIRVSRIVAVVDCGAVINPDIARQQIEGGLIFGLALALGSAAHYPGDLPRSLRLGDYLDCRAWPMSARSSSNWSRAMRRSPASARSACCRSRPHWRVRCRR